MPGDRLARPAAPPRGRQECDTPLSPLGRSTHRARHRSPVCEGTGRRPGREKQQPSLAPPMESRSGVAFCKSRELRGDGRATARRADRSKDDDTPPPVPAHVPLERSRDPLLHPKNAGPESSFRWVNRGPIEGLNRRKRRSPGKRKSPPGKPDEKGRRRRRPPPTWMTHSPVSR